MDDVKTAVRKAWANAQENSAGLLSAGIAFYAFLAFMPLIAAIIMTYGLVVDADVIARQADDLAKALPPSAADLVVKQFNAVASDKSGKNGWALVAALGFALFGARVAAGAVITAFNIAFNAPESRGLVKANVLALCITIGAVIAIGLVAATTALIAIVFPASGNSFFAFAIVGIFGFGGALAAYRIVPNVDDVTIKSSWRGALLFALGWMIASSGFGFYASNISNYNATYGSLGAVVVLLTWLFLSAYLLLLGAHIAAVARLDLD